MRIDTGTDYSNLTSPWPSALLLVPKPGPDKFTFIVDLHFVMRF